MTLSDSIQTNAEPAYPFMTIAIPTYNRASYLKGCIASALSQTYPHFEVVVSNNASSDDTPSILRRFNDPRLRVFNQASNIGMHPNWNACLASAKGDYIVFVSDDDRVAPWLLERCARLVRQRPQVPAVVTLSNIHAASLGRTKPARASRVHDTGIWDGPEILMDFLTDQVTITMCSVLMRTDLLRAHGGLPLDMPYTGDIAVWAPLLFLGKAGLVNEACATFTYHSNSETARSPVELLLRDGQKAVELIERAAEIHVADPRQRKRIQIQARRCFARRGLIDLSDCHRRGGGIRDLLKDLWRFRRELYGADLKAVLRFIAVVSCPRPIVTQLRQLSHSIPERLA